MIEIEIDGNKLTAQPGDMIIQVADEAGIYIPRFCYHEKLSIAANCRMCFVEVEKAPKTLPACATPIAPGMKIFTRSEKALFSQKAVMEFLLINHPLDCPICDQGGECELQDLSMGYGRGLSRYQQPKRSVKDKDLGPLVSSEMTRCIQCTRCVRFGDEIAGMRELGATDRGEDMEIGTYIQHALQSELSGNVIDVCPVGALTSKPYRFTASAWEMRQHPSLAPHDCLGSHTYLHTRGEEYSTERHVMRVVPREYEPINEVWLSDRDRYSYEGIYSPARLTQPWVKRDGQWQAVSWEVALEEASQRLQRVLSESGPQMLGALISPSATLEEGYLLQKLMRGLGCHNIDHRLQQMDFRDQHAEAALPRFELSIAELENLDAVLLIGSDLRREQPIANQRLRKAIKKGGQAFCVNPVDYDGNFALTAKYIVAGDDFIQSLLKILKALSSQTEITTPPADIRQGTAAVEVDKAAAAQAEIATLPADIRQCIAAVEVDEVATAIANKLNQHPNTAVLLGAYALNHPQGALIRALSLAIAKLSQSRSAYFTTGANAAGHWLAGAIPHRLAAGQSLTSAGLNASEMLTQSLRAYVLVGVEPELDSAVAGPALTALSAAQTVVAISAYRNPAMEEYADILLPMAVFAETAATYVNCEGHWQSTNAAALPLGEAKPAWKILRVLANLFALPGFDYVTSEQVRDELKEQIDQVVLPPASEWLELPAAEKMPALHRIAEWPMYRVDSVVRHADSLQATLSPELSTVRVHPSVAQQLNVTSGTEVMVKQQNQKLSLPLLIDHRIAPGQVAIPAGLAATAGFGTAFGEITLIL